MEQSQPFSFQPAPPDRQCQARSKRSGERCKNWACRGRSVCRFHGGKSTGPKTAEGQERSRTARLVHGNDSLDILKARQTARVLDAAAGFIEMLQIFSTVFVQRKIEAMSYVDFRAARPMFTRFCKGELSIYQLIEKLDGKKPRISKPIKRNSEDENT